VTKQALGLLSALADETALRLGLGESANHAEQNAADWLGGKALPAALYLCMRRPARTLPPGQDHAFGLRTQGGTHRCRKNQICLEILSGR